MDEVKMKQPAGGVQLGPITEETPLMNQQQEIQNLVPTQVKSGPNLANRFLLEGPREEYLNICVPLYEASIKCDWKEAEKILTDRDNIELEVVRCGITESGETALHVAAAAKVPKKVEGFVANLVKLMRTEDLELENANYNTALYLAAAAGNIEAVKIMMEKNDKLLSIPGGGSRYSKPKMMPMYTAALFGNHDLARYMYEKSKDLTEGGWTDKTRGWLLEKCVDNDMFDIALKILEKHKSLASSGSLLGVLARKPDAFKGKKYNLIWRFIVWVFALCGCNVGAYDKESEAVQLLKLIWKDISKYRKEDIDRIFRGPPDPIKHDDKSGFGKVVQVVQLQNLVSEHVSKMKDETEKIMRVLPASVDQDKKMSKADQSLQLQQLISKQLVKMHVETQSIIKEGTKQVIELQKVISEYLLNMHVATHNIIRGPSTSGQEDQALRLQNLISKNTPILLVNTQSIINKGPVVPSSSSKSTYSSRMLFVAAAMGNTKFLVELIRRYPDVIWKVDDNGLSIFHIAVKHRHEGIYNLLHEGAMKDLITPLRDENGNNMLHLAGMRANKKRLEDVSGVVLELQRELLWFQEIESMLPPSFRERRNSDGLTPHELFTKEHKDMVTQGEIWMKEIASQCMVVAALIATMVFATAFTVPGGYDQNNGLPIFYSKATFKVFVVADAISLFSSSASILYMFLSVFTSRYVERDFLESVPRKLIIGMSYLFLSMTTMIIAFSISFFVLYQKGLLWIPILISGCALIPFGIYVKAQYILFIEIIRSTYRSKNIFKPKKPILYYKNPTV